MRYDETEDISVGDVIWFFVVILTTVGMIGSCSFAAYKTVTTKTTYGKINNVILPKGMESCEVYNTKYGNVVKCPNSTTSTHYYVSNGKTGYSVDNTVIDGGK